jgi:tryptophanyl-tRNA synthetase
MVVDWLAAGVDPAQATIFIQSRVPEHAELHLLMSMMTPQGWLERVPTYKDQQEKLTHKDLTTYGFLGYPLLMSADILIYRADKVPVGEDQLPHVEFTRELARRFNHMYGREPGFEEKAKEAVKKLGSKRARLVRGIPHPLPAERRRAKGWPSARPCLKRPRTCPWAIASASIGYLEGSGKMILVDPECAADRGFAHARSRWPEDVQVLRQHHFLREEAETAHQENPHHADRPGSGCGAPIRAIRRSARCGSSTSSTPTTATQAWVHPGLQERRHRLYRVQAAGDRRRAEGAGPCASAPSPTSTTRSLVRSIVADGCDQARKLAQETMRDVRDAMGLITDERAGGRFMPWKQHPRVLA